MAYERISKNDTWKYQYVSYEDNDPSKPMANIIRNGDGSINEKSTYSPRYLSSIENKSKYSVSEKIELGGEIAGAAAGFAIEAFIDSLPWPINWLVTLLWWLVTLLWWIIKGIYWIISLPFKFIFSLFH